MASVAVHRDDVQFDSAMLVEGLPGIGLVGKIAADHLVEELDLVHYASVHCDGLPEVAVFRADESNVQAPVRLYADPDQDLLVLQSDVPVSPKAAKGFTGCLTGWLETNDITPIYLSGLPSDRDGDPTVSGIATGDADGLLTYASLEPPEASGAISGPTGALLHEAQRTGLRGVGLVVEADAQFPDPEAARALLIDGIEPLTSVDVDTEPLVERAQEISQAKAELAQQMQEASDESTQAQPIGMYQ